MKKLFTLSLMLISFFCIAQTKVGNVELPNELVIKNYQIQLHGAGTRVKFWMDMYAMGLYLTEDMNQPDQIINKDESMGIRLEIISGLISSEKMEKATREGFKNATQGNTQSIKAEIEDFISVFRSGVDKKDIFEFVYIPDEGTLVYKNGDLKTSISSLVFKKALFGIWLCKKPADKNLKKDLLK